MKEVLKATVAMVVIIAVQMVLTYVFTYHVGEVFSKLWHCSIIMLLNMSKQLKSTNLGMRTSKRLLEARKACCYQKLLQSISLKTHVL